MKKLNILIIFLLFFLIQNIYAGWFSNDQPKKGEFYDFLARFVQKESKNLPRLIDKHTRIDSVYTHKDEMIVRYTISKGVINRGESVYKPYLDKQLKNYYCTNPDMIYFRKFNAKVIREYYDEDGKYLIRSIASIKDC